MVFLTDESYSLITKLQKRIDEHYLNGTQCDIDDMEDDLLLLEIAVDSKDPRTMKIILKKYAEMFGKES